MREGDKAASEYHTKQGAAMLLSSAPAEHQKVNSQKTPLALRSPSGFSQDNKKKEIVSCETISEKGDIKHYLESKQATTLNISCASSSGISSREQA